MTSTGKRTDHLTVLQMYELDQACDIVRRALDMPYLVGSVSERPDFRDVDVRVMLDDSEFDALFKDRPALWELLCMSVSVYLRDRTGLPIDFQVQRESVANARYGDKPRNPVGMVRIFAGRGDAT